VVAINKIDKENASPDKIKKELSEKGVQIEEWGGKIPSINISAKTGEGVDELLETVVLATDLEELKTAESVNASGFVIESNVDKKRGVAATLVIQNGFLKQGMCVTCGQAFAPVRIFEDFSGRPIKQAGASSPVKIVGFNKMPQVGERFESFACKKDVPAFSDSPEKVLPGKGVETGTTKGGVAVPIIIKADAAGSVEALEKQFRKLQTEKVLLNILKAEVGDINEDDIKIASSGDKAMVIGFHVDFPGGIKVLAERLGVEVELFDIIYKAEEWLEEEIKKREPKEEKEEIIGKARILKIFRDEKTKKIIGGEVISGKILLGRNVKIFRRDFLLGEGKISELQQQQTKKEEVSEGEQFGALLQTKVGVAPKDTLDIVEKI